MSLDVLPADVIEKARRELNEDPETRLGKIEELREKTKNRPDLNIHTTDKDLIRFLRARKFDVDLAYELLVAHYECKLENPEIYTNFNPSAEKKTFDSGWNIAFPDRDQDGCKIFVFRPGCWNPDERTLINNLRANIIALEILIQDEVTQISGIKMIADFRNFGLKQAKSMNPLIFKRYGKIMFNCYPVRIKGIHILEQPAVFSVIFAIISQFMKEKLRNRVVLHGTQIQKLHEFINKDILPADYSGSGPSCDIRDWVKYVIGAEEELEHLWS